MLYGLDPPSPGDACSWELGRAGRGGCECEALQALEVVKELSLVPSKIVENSSAGFDIQFGPLLEGPEADRLESLLFATDYIPIRKFID